MVPAAVVFLVFLAGTVRSQIWDMADGNDEGLIFPCQGGPIGLWVEEPAILYPGGPDSGLVLTSANYAASCLDTPTSVVVTRTSKLRLYVRVPYSLATDYFDVWLVRDVQWFLWYSISGPVPAGQEWISDSIPLPSHIAEGEYLLRVWDMSATQSMSLRYMEINGNGTITNTTTTSSTQATSTTISSISSTTTPMSEHTTERYTTPERTTERYSTPERTTERFSTPIKTTERPTAAYVPVTKAVPANS